MRISAHTNVTNPERMGYPYLESIKSFADFCDEVIVVDGGSTDGSLEKIAKIDKVRIVKGNRWKKDFDWTILPKNLQIGYENCQYEWAFKFDADYIFHEKWVDELKKDLERCSFPALELRKCNYVTLDRYFKKDYYPFVVNKKDYPAIHYGIGHRYKEKDGASFMWPIVKKSTRKDGVHMGEFLTMSEVRLLRSNVEVYCYDFSFMTKEQVIRQRVRFDNALREYLTGKKCETSEEGAYKNFIGMMKSRHRLCDREGITNVKIEDHSRFIRDKVKNLKSSLFGYNMWEEL